MAPTPTSTLNDLDFTESETIQSLWSGYGKLLRVKDQSGKTYILKHIQLSENGNHPRGWNTQISHRRKAKSYEIELYWYQHFAKPRSLPRIPKFIDAKKSANEFFLLMEDLDQAGYDLRKTSVSDTEIKACLHWLAQFHGTYLGVQPEELWPVGTYWHLNTRPDELKAMPESDLKSAAPQLDGILNSCTYKTIVHGDAKLANFCFSANGKVAAVDFQYVGGGCGMKDVIYFLSSCLTERQLDRQADGYIDYYFKELSQAIPDSLNFEQLAYEWREMYPYAWADFVRFLEGWMPGHYKLHGYSRRLTLEAISKLNGS